MKYSPNFENLVLDEVRHHRQHRKIPLSRNYRVPSWNSWNSVRRVTVRYRGRTNSWFGLGGTALGGRLVPLFILVMRMLKAQRGEGTRLSRDRLLHTADWDPKKVSRKKTQECKLQLNSVGAGFLAQQIKPLLAIAGSHTGSAGSSRGCPTSDLALC